MTTRTIPKLSQEYTRAIGWLYLSLLPIDIFCYQYVPAHLVVPGDTAATAKNILDSELVFRLGIMSALVGQLILIAVVLNLYRILTPVSKSMARLMVICLLVAVPIGMLAELNQLAILLLLHGSGGFPVEQVPALVSFFLDMHTNGIRLAEIFWGLWLLPMGYLVFRSRFLPRIIGGLLIIAGFGYLIQSFVEVLFPNSGVNMSLFTSWGEVIFPLWLGIKGINGEQWVKRAHALA
jgi:hypothetical protein